MKVASVGLLALVALTLVTDASVMEFQDDSVDPTEESSFYEHRGVAPSKHHEAPLHHHAKASRAPRHVQGASLHPLEPSHQKSTKSLTKEKQAPETATPYHMQHHSVRHADMEMEEEDEDHEDTTTMEQEQDYTPVEDEDDEDLHMKGQAVLESIDADSLEDDLDDLNEVDMEDEKQPPAAMASAAASSRQHHEWKPKPSTAVELNKPTDKHQESVLATIKAMRTKPKHHKLYPGQAVVNAFKPAAVSALASKPHKAKKNKDKSFVVVEDAPPSYGKTKATGFLADHSWMLGAGQSYGGYRKTGKRAAVRKKRAQREIADFIQSDNAESSATSRYSYENVKRVAAGKTPTVFAQELHDGASRDRALLAPKFRSMRGQYRATSTDDHITVAQKKANKELQALLAAGGVKIEK